MTSTWLFIGSVETDTVISERGCVSVRQSVSRLLYETKECAGYMRPTVMEKASGGPAEKKS